MYRLTGLANTLFFPYTHPDELELYILCTCVHALSVAMVTSFLSIGTERTLTTSTNRVVYDVHFSGSSAHKA